MLFSRGHGGRSIIDTFTEKDQGTATGGFAEARTAFTLNTERAPFIAAASRAMMHPAAEPETDKGAFRYFFPEAEEFPQSDEMLAALDALADDTFSTTRPAIPVNIPPILTYFGQFIDHDITANTDRKVEGLSEIEGVFEPAERLEVTEGLDNLRDGSLGLDSLYGDSVGQSDFANKLAGLMRHPTFTGMMRLGIPETSDGGPIRPPADDATDLLRLGFLLDNGLLTEAELNALDPDLRDMFFKDGQPNRFAAIIGDGRNDENLLIAQLQVAFLRLHNKMVLETGSFERARKMTQYHYQWMVAHEFLPELCDRAIVDELIAKESPIYGDFFDQHEPEMAPQMPMPLEFSVAAFRFGHSMVRGRYDHNHVFGIPEPGLTNLIPGGAPFDLFFRFTGSGGMNPDSDRQLPDNWVIDWSRFVNAETPRRSAEGIDTRLEHPLDDMPNAREGVFKHLARRNLRRGYRLNIPSAQACIAAINASGKVNPIAVLDPDVVLDGRDIAGADFGNHTPLWFYVLREAEVMGSSHLGPLGTHIVAGTILGLIMKDPTSYWNDMGAGHRWRPTSFRPGAPITNLKEMLRFTGQLA